MASEAIVAVRRAEATQRLGKAKSDLAKRLDIEVPAPPRPSQDPQLDDVLMTEHVAEVLEGIASAMPDEEEEKPIKPKDVNLLVWMRLPQEVRESLKEITIESAEQVIGATDQKLKEGKGISGAALKWLRALFTAPTEIVVTMPTAE